VAGLNAPSSESASRGTLCLGLLPSLSSEIVDRHTVHFQLLYSDRANVDLSTLHRSFVLAATTTPQIYL
jgi:hypothetical protein